MKKFVMSMFAAFVSTSALADTEKTYYRDDNNIVNMYHLTDEDIKTCAYGIRGSNNELYTITNNSRYFIFIVSEEIPVNYYDVAGPFVGMLDFYNSNGQLIGNYPMVFTPDNVTKYAVAMTDTNVIEYLLTARSFDTLTIGFTPHNEEMSFKRTIPASRYMNKAMSSYLDCVQEVQRYSKYGEDRVYD